MMPFKELRAEVLAAENLEVAELLGHINRLTAQRDQARRIAVQLEQENAELCRQLTEALL